MKKSKVLGIISIMLMIAVMLTGCAKAKMDTAKNEATIPQSTAARDASNNFTAMDSSTDTVGTAEEELLPEETADTAGENQTEKPDGKEGVDNSSALSGEALPVGAQDKIIQKYYLDVETKEFDDLITKLDKQINRLGGYVESSQVGGSSIYSSSEAKARNASIVARIPSKKAGEFVSSISKNANVVNNQKSSENVSLQYIDAQSRIKALQIEQDRLFAILEKADDLDSIITLETRLGEIRYELQNYESQLRSYDNQVEYSTVTLNIMEVERMTPVTKVKETFASRVKKGFGNTLYHISTGFTNFLVWFIVNLPYLIIWGILILIIVLIARKSVNKNKAKKQEQEGYWHLNPGQQNQEQQNQGQQNKDQQNKEQ